MECSKFFAKGFSGGTDVGSGSQYVVFENKVKPDGREV
jgi:hypothetical protein